MSNQLGWLAVLLKANPGYEMEVNVSAMIGLYVIAFLASCFESA